MTHSPAEAVHLYCLQCCNGSAKEVRLCEAKSCALWLFRLGPGPTAEMLAEVGERPLHPHEVGWTVAAFYESGGTRLKAIKLYCLDCSGCSKGEVRACRHTKCYLYPFRQGKNPNRTLSPEQRARAAAQLKANVSRAKKTSGALPQGSLDTRRETADDPGHPLGVPTSPQRAGSESQRETVLSDGQRPIQRPAADREHLGLAQRPRAKRKPP
jgi:hypothetical protein